MVGFQQHAQCWTLVGRQALALADEYSVAQNSAAKLSVALSDTAAGMIGIAELVAGNAELVVGNAARNAPAVDSTVLAPRPVGNKLEAQTNSTARKK